MFDKGFKLSRNYLPGARESFTLWYKNQAYIKIKESLDFYSHLSGLKYNNFKLSNARKRWGSCSGKDDLYFSWLLIMAPPEVVDYVVVHELVHQKEKNHSKDFWKKVEGIMPDYKKHRKWLKENGHLLTLDAWMVGGLDVQDVPTWISAWVLKW